MIYPAELTPEGRGHWLVRFPDIPEALTEGKGELEALRMAEDCLGCALAGLMTHGEAIPRPSRVKTGQWGVAVPVWVAGKAALYSAIRERGWSNGELARRLGVSETVVRRMLNPRHETKSEKLAAALRVVGKKLVVTVEAA
jgi:antitoxin HicB